MDEKKLSLYGKIINIVLIVITLVMFIAMNFLDSPRMGINSGTYQMYKILMTIIDVWRGISVVALLISIFLLIKGGVTNQGFILLVISALASVIFSFARMMIGVVVVILSSLSIKKLSEQANESSFKDKLGL